MALADLHRARKYINRRRLHVATSHLCSLVAGLLYVVWMILLVFCMDLLDHKGIASFAGEDARYAMQIEPAQGTSSVDVYQRQNTGLLPTLVRLRDQWYAPALERLYRGVPLCRTDVGLLLLIAIVAMVIGVVRFILLLLQSRLLVTATADAQSRLQTEIFNKQFELGGNAVSTNNQQKSNLSCETTCPPFSTACKTTWNESFASR